MENASQGVPAIAVALVRDDWLQSSWVQKLRLFPGHCTIKESCGVGGVWRSRM